MFLISLSIYMKKDLILFDVDGTIAESGYKINNEMKKIFKLLHKNSNVELGIVGGGKFEKILWQLDDIKDIFTHYFSECGCVYHKKSNQIYRKNIRDHNLYSKINILIKLCLNFIGNVDYEITGNFIDLRSGIIYISLIGMNATQNEREKFIDLDNKFNYRVNLLTKIKIKAKELNISEKIHIVLGGSVGIAIYPNEFDKQQIMNVINKQDYKTIYYFGDKYQENGNDFLLLNHKDIIPYRVDSIQDTLEILNKNFI